MLLIREIRRRRVFRTAGLYIVGAWLVMQAADVFFPAWGLGSSALNVLLLAAVFGFPLALVFGWFFDITSQGIVRTPPADASEANDDFSLQRSDYMILGALAVVAGIIVYNATSEIIEAPVLDEGGTAAITDAAIPEKVAHSIAVLPFVNDSNDPNNEAFCDGISAEILHKLSQFGELHVIGRTSSFAFKGSNYRIPTISQLLGVSYLLQGSVRQAGEKIRVNAQLVDEDGAQQWSGQFDRNLDDIFAIQTEIADVVATTVVPQISPEPHSERSPDLAAYQHYLAGQALLYRRERGGLEEFEKAIELDPHFAEAYADYAIFTLIGQPTPARIEAATKAIDMAISLKPGLPRALAARGLLFSQQYEPDWNAAEQVLRDALARDPSMIDAMNWLAGSLNAQGRKDEAFEIHLRALEIDPLHGAIGINVANTYYTRGDPDRAEQILLRLTSLPQPIRFAFTTLRDQYAEQGRLVEMNDIEKRSALTGLHVYYGLGWNYALLNEPDRAAYWLKLTQRDFPDFASQFAYDALPMIWQGRFADGLQAFHDHAKKQGARVADMAPISRYLLARLLAFTGDFEGAVDTLVPMLGNSPASDVYDQFENYSRVVLAWSYGSLGNSKQADEVLQDLEQLQTSQWKKGLAETSQLRFEAATTALLLGHHELALDRLEKAIEMGWRQYYTHIHEPFWAPLADNPRYKALMSEVKADVDRQRTEVARIDAEEDFADLLEATRQKSN